MAFLSNVLLQEVERERRDPRNQAQLVHSTAVICWRDLKKAVAGLIVLSKFVASFGFGTTSTSPAYQIRQISRMLDSAHRLWQGTGLFSRLLMLCSEWNKHLLIKNFSCKTVGYSCSRDTIRDLRYMLSEELMDVHQYWAQLPHHCE